MRCGSTEVAQITEICRPEIQVGDLLPNCCITCYIL